MEKTHFHTFLSEYSEDLVVEYLAIIIVVGVKHTALYQSKTGLETLTLLNQLILKPEHLWDVLYPNPVDGDHI